MLQSLIIAFMSVCGIGFTAAMIYDRVRKKRVLRLLASRPCRDDGIFARRFFGESEQEADIAIRLRKVLGANLEISLLSLQADDRLDADLSTEVVSNPDLFWAIEKEFGVQTRVMDWEAHEPEVNNLTTFRDLVRYVEGKISDRDESNDRDPSLTNCDRENG